MGKLSILFLYLSTAAKVIVAFDPSSVICAPGDRSIQLGSDEMKYCNGLCSSAVPWWINTSKYCNALFAIATWGIYALWSRIPRVGRTFGTLKACDEKVKALKLSSTDLEKTVRYLCRQQDGRKWVNETAKKTLTTVCCDLWISKKEFPICVRTWYLIRIVLVIILNFSALFVAWYVLDTLQNPTFMCKQCQVTLRCLINGQQVKNPALYLIIISDSLSILGNILLILKFLPNYRATYDNDLFSMKYVLPSFPTLETKLHFITRLAVLFTAMLITKKLITCNSDMYWIFLILGIEFVLIQWYGFLVHYAMLRRHRFLKHALGSSYAYRSPSEEILPHQIIILIFALCSVVTAYVFVTLECSTESNIHLALVAIWLYISTSIMGLWGKIPNAPSIPTIKNVDNAFAVQFADGATDQWSESTMKIVFPEKVLRKDLGLDIYNIIYDLKTRSFRQSKDSKRKPRSWTVEYIEVFKRTFPIQQSE